MDTQHDQPQAPGRSEAEQTLLALRLGELSDDDIVTALAQFGAIRLLDARPSVEQLLESGNPRVRGAALETLLRAFQLTEHVESARRFLSDPDTGCRLLAMRYFQETLGHAIDFDTLSLLARIATTSQETDELRLEAYCTVLAILNVPLTLRHLRDIAGFPGSGRRFEDLSWIDWDLLALLYESQQEQPRRYCTLLGSISLRYYADQAALTRDGSLLACTSGSSEGVLFAVEVWNLRTSQYRLLCTTERSSLEIGGPYPENDEAREGLEGRSQGSSELRSGGKLEATAGELDDEEEIVERDLVAWSCDGRYLAVAGRDGVLDVWVVNWGEGREGRRLLSHRSGRGYQALCWGNQNHCLAAATSRELLFWQDPWSPLLPRAYPPKDIEFFLPERDSITALAFTPDDAALFTGDTGGRIVQWSVREGRPLAGWSWETGGGMPVFRLACSPDGKRVAVHNITGNEIDGVTGEATSIVYRPQDQVFRFGDGQSIEDILGWSPDGTLLLGIRFEHFQSEVYVTLLDAFTGDLVASYEVSARTFPELHPRDFFRTFDAALAPDGKTIYWCATVERHSPTFGMVIPELTWHGLIALPPVLHAGPGGLRTRSAAMGVESKLTWQVEGDEQLTERVLIPTLRMLRSLLARGDTVTLSLQISEGQPAQ